MICRIQADSAYFLTFIDNTLAEVLAGKLCGIPNVLLLCPLRRTSGCRTTVDDTARYSANVR